MLSLLTVNIQAAAPLRARRLLEWLAGRDEDVVVLTETSNGPGTVLLLGAYRAAGWSVFHTPSSDGDRGCAIVTRLPATARPGLTAGVSLPARAVAVTVNGDVPITVLGVYVPSNDRAPAKLAKKQMFVGTLLAAITAVPEADRARMLLAGDVNAVRRDHQPAHRGFLPFEYDLHDQLNALGLSDLHRHLNPGVQEHSWFGRAGAGYQYDYLYAGTDLRDLARECRYDQRPRLDGLSDHAGVTTTLALPGSGERLAPPQGAAELTLF